MASSSGRTGKPANRSPRKGNSSGRGRAQRIADTRQIEQDTALFHEIGLIVLFVAMVILFFCNFGLIGPVGEFFSGILFGLFGLTAYIAPILLFVAVAFRSANEGSPNATRKLIAGIVLFMMAGVICDIIIGNASALSAYDIKAIYESSAAAKSGGGVLGGSTAYLLHRYLGTIGAVLVVVLCSAISLILLTEKSLLGGVKKRSEHLMERSAEESERRREAARLRREEQERLKSVREEERRLKEEEKENEKILRMDKKAGGVTLDTSLKPAEESGRRRDDMHEITYSEGGEETDEVPGFDFGRINIRTAHQLNISEAEGQEEPVSARQPETPLNPQAEQIRIHREETPESVRTDPVRGAGRPQAAVPQNAGGSQADNQVQNEIRNGGRRMPKKYVFPPLSCLQKGLAATGDSTRELKETAMRLQQTLNTFGVKVSITDISQGPSVTRYELQPEQGVKVSKIVGLSDDIKLNLAATDIRIEAPIPGKAAIGIEVPNKENMVVALRDLLDSREFKEFPSSIAFAVGKDIAGKTVVADIAKMPHMLIAGSTGSGKSVCINTLIMSILYKAHPDDVKLIMVDPKVVELSVYNGIPHLLIPVVTEPKKASAALHWAVSEMEERYRRFADYNVRDLKGYNKKIETMGGSGGEAVPGKLPQIVIIVDELADLMMVSPGEVEESICRLAQLARACGIHLIIATQRPSVDVITGLIKNNMPSRVAFAVSSGTDSRTILDTVGAERLLGKGDMLFYPQGYSKPARIQGAFVSDKEVSDVVDFLKNQMLGNVYAEEIEEKIKSIGSASGGFPGGAGGAGGDDDRDEYFAEAGRLVIEKEDKASIGMLQRAFKIGFNRAARIMDQLSEYGVVGDAEGTKSRKVMMTMEEFEQLLEDI